MNPLEAEILRMAEETVKMARSRNGATLDYSEASLEIVEEMLDEASKFSADFSESEMRLIVEPLGCYVLEVARRALGGDYFWTDDHEQPILVVGEPEFHAAMIAWDKVRGRLNGDTGDNIPFFFTGFAHHVRTAAPGSRALYV